MVGGDRGWNAFCFPERKSCSRESFPGIENSGNTFSAFDDSGVVCVDADDAVLLRYGVSNTNSGVVRFSVDLVSGLLVNVLCLERV